MNLVLIARKANLLNEIADDIKSKYAVKVDVIIADFGKGIDIYKEIEESLADKVELVNSELMSCKQSAIFFPKLSIRV
jgi:short-subunit dehydrogenase